MTLIARVGWAYKSRDTSSGTLVACGSVAVAVAIHIGGSARGRDDLVLGVVDRGRHCVGTSEEA